MATSTPSNKMLSSQQLSNLSREELVSQLLKAQEKIQFLEAIHKQNEHSPTYLSDNSLNSCVSSNPGISKSTEESIFAYPSGASVDSSCDDFELNQIEVINELQLKLKEIQSGDTHKAFNHYNNEEFIVAYEYKGNFPSCDEDLSSESSTDEESDPKRSKDIHKRKQDDENDINENGQSEGFPLIPSPVLNTPPYEYIFLTKTNEAKYRIFLNQKLNKVFQEELHKLQKLEEQLIKEKSQNTVPEANDNVCDDQSTEASKPDNIDLHNQNHLASSDSESESISSVSKFIHCFDASEVDIELKKIFTEKPPITHKIVRRKTRRERGSSVPAVDSYYGTRDLHKVGHASYFIPMLTESERKAIGWKSEYHYGHWKYGALNVPTHKTNQISLHPHVESKESTQSKYHSGTLPQNPLHHHEIDLTEPFVMQNLPNMNKEDSAVLQHNPCCKHQHPHHEDANANQYEDTLSFITLSGGSKNLSQSCHIIPDKSTLRRILKWILPCIKLSSNNVSKGSEAIIDHFSHGDKTQDSGDNASKSISKKKSKSSKKHPEIETLVEPFGKLNFPPSQTCISIASASAAEHSIIHHNAEFFADRANYYYEQDDYIQEQTGPSSLYPHHKERFHWKNILSNHDFQTSTESTNAEDVVDPLQDYIGILNEKPPSAGENDTLERNFESSSTGSDSDDNYITSENGQKKKLRKLKACKAHTKLLTLKDLGYESDGVVESEEKDDRVKIYKQLQISSVSSTSETDFTECASKKPPPPQSTDKAKQSNREASDRMNFDGNEDRKYIAVPNDRTLSSGMNSSLVLMSGSTPGNMSCGGSGFAFSSMSISHQNSGIVENLTESSSPSASIIDQQLNGIETRFLDPKDLLAQQVNKPIQGNELVDEDSLLPFIFDFPSMQYQQDAEEDDVIEWMGYGFTDDIGDGEGLGLLSSCLTKLLQHDKLVTDQYLQNGANSHQTEYDNGPDKVVGQHRIATLTDLTDQRDAENQND